jgi:ATP-dependent Clp protease ATP-binding subunit ClpC
LTTGSELAWRVAGIEAREIRAATIGPDLLLVGLLSLAKLLDPATPIDDQERTQIRDEHDAVNSVLAAAACDPATLRRAIRRRIPLGEVAHATIRHRDPDCRKVFERAAALAASQGGVRTGPLHLLFALLEAPSPVLLAALADVGGDLNRLRWRVEAAITPTRPASPPLPAPTPDRSGPFVTPTGPGVMPGSHPSPIPGPISPSLALLRYGRDLTAEAAAGRLRPVIGRRDELLQVVRVLRRLTKSNPVLIGEAGVGKTAIVEGLAQRIAASTSLPGRRIIALTLSSVVAGTTYRGQFEERLEQILAELRANPDVILFLDELHTIVGAGDSDGRLDAASILKPALARGEISCIGATTIDEYRRAIESDPALDRRFQPIQVPEPSPAETRLMLAGLCPDLERHQDVTIAPDALDAAIELTVRYLPSRQLPDKAVDALDEACARVSVPTLTLPGEPAERLAGRDDAAPVRQRPLVTREIVARVVAGWTGIPIGSSDGAHLLDLEARLGRRIVGQDEAIRQVATQVRMARTGLTDPNRPAGVFLFLGPSGIGKTELARALAEALSNSASGGPDRLLRLDMSEYAEKQATSRLIGAPPGYVGHDEEGQLSGPLRLNPYAVVLLDEIEKAHPDVFDLFLQVFDAGRLTDARGRTVDARHATFIMTSNLLPPESAQRRLGFAPDAAPRLADPVVELRRFFKPELLNRIDEIVVFEPLTPAQLAEIARRRVAVTRERLLAQHEVDLVVPAEALAVIVAQIGDGKGGARDVSRVVARLLEAPLSRMLMAGEIVRQAQVIAEPAGDRLHIVDDARTV